MPAQKRFPMSADSPKDMDFRLEVRLLVLALGSFSVSCGLIAPSTPQSSEDAAVSGDPRGRVLGISGHASGAEICIENFTEDSQKCSGAVLVKETKEVVRFQNGTCQQKGLTAEAQAGDTLSFGCALPDGSSCFAKAGISEPLLLDAKLKGPWNPPSWTFEDKEGGGQVQILAQRKSCAEVFSVSTQAPAQPPPQCPPTSQGASLALSGATPAVSRCLSLSGGARSNCLLLETAMEVYDTAGPGDVADIKAGKRSPDRCYINFPEATAQSRHFFIYKSGSGYQGAIALGSVGAGAATDSLSYNFTKFYDRLQPNSVVVVNARSADYVSPSPENQGQPDLSSGYWVMSGYRVVRFVPKSWCAEQYLRASLDLSAIQSAGRAPTQSEGAGGSGQPAPQSPSQPPAPPAGAGGQPSSGDASPCQ